MSFSGWLDARDGEAVAREWATLGAKRVEVVQPSSIPLGIKPEGAALMAAAFLGCSPERFAWFAAEPPYDDDDDDDDDDDNDAAPAPTRRPPPTFAVGRTVTRCFLDGAVDLSHECGEEWEIREVIEGTRGIQHITIHYYWGEMTRDGGNGGGGSVTVVRAFDRATSSAVAIHLWATEVWTIGEPIDLAPLDLFAHRTTFKLPWRTYDPDSLRGFLAQLTADLDAHFDTSTTWPGGVTQDRVIDNREYNFSVRRRVYRFESGPYAIELDELLDPDGKSETGWLIAKVHGLSWGHAVSARIDSTDDPVWGVSGWVDLTLPRAQLDATRARLAAVPGIQVS